MHLGTSRRRFLAATAGATTFNLLKPALVFGAQANSRISLGVIGCGGRGSWIARLFAESGLYHVTACSDYFLDRIEAVGEAHDIPSTRRYAGLNGYRQLLDSDVDAVVIETPPYFHPQQAMDAVDAAKHVFLAKPIAVDVPGCLSIAQTGTNATARNLVFLVDFQTRANEHYREALRRVRQGDLGRIIMAEAFYPWSGGGRGGPPTSAEEQLRQWYYVLPLSGDFIVEQAIHALDVATWILNADPVQAVGLGGRAMRPNHSIYDHFALTYTFPNDIPLSFTCIQAIPAFKDEIRCRAYGTEGYIDTDYFGDVWIRGNDPYKGGSTGNLYTEGTLLNIREFHQSITQRQYANPTVAPSVRANLTAVLGREAGYRRTEVTLAELLHENRSLNFNLSGLRG